MCTAEMHDIKFNYILHLTQVKCMLSLAFTLERNIFTYFQFFVKIQFVLEDDSFTCFNCIDCVLILL